MRDSGVAFAVKTTLQVSGDDFKAIRDRTINPRAFMRVAGVRMMSQGLQRHQRQRKPGQIGPVSILQALTVGTRGRGGGREGSLFDSGQYSVTVGVRLPHARIVQQGGTILPKTGKALAVPLIAQLARHGRWPRDLDPSRETLDFVPAKKSGNVIGFLVDREGDFGFGENKALFMLLRKSTQKARPYLYFDEADRKWHGEALKRFIETGRAV